MSGDLTAPSNETYHRSAVKYRRILHAIPELGFDLPKTLAFVEGHLMTLGAEVFSPARSSLCVYFDNGAESTIAFRADMDGLPVSEVSTEDWVSTHEGRMHACGHDAHMGMLLALCDYVAAHRSTLPHNVLAIFQPAEETTGGARQICETGVLDRYGVQAVFGLHMWPGFAAGQVVTRRGELMARCSETTVKFYGKSVHIARASEGADALLAAAIFLPKAYQMVKDALPSDVPRLLKFGRLESGTVCNVISGYSQLEGSLRSFSNMAYELMCEQLEEIAADVSEATGCRIEIEIDPGYPPVVNDADLVDHVTSQVEAPVLLLDEPPMTGEDFSFYQQEVPGVFFFLGTGNDEALHSAEFTIDETALASGVDFLQQLLRVKF